MNIPEVSVAEAKKILEKGNSVFVDVRDPLSYQEDHLPGAVHLTSKNVQSFLESADKNKPLIIYCYHGNTSLGAAAYFLEQGFGKVFSMTGGFEAWRENNHLTGESR